MRKLAARIVAHLAGDLHLPRFPGAIQCISYLLQDETTLAYSDQQGLTPIVHKGGLHQTACSLVDFWADKRGWFWFVVRGKYC